MRSVFATACASLCFAGMAHGSLSLTSPFGETTEISDLSGYSMLEQDALRGSVAPADTYTSAMLAFSTGGGVFLNTGPFSYTFDGAPESGGTQIFNPPFDSPVSVIEATIPSTTPGDFFVVVETSVNPGGDLLPTFTLNNATADALVQDIGIFNSAGPSGLNDPITYNSSDIAVELLGVDIILFSGGTPFFGTTIAQTDFASGSIDLSTSWLLNGANGLGIDAVQTVFNLRDVPTPGSLGVLLGGVLLAGRRRR